MAPGSVLIHLGLPKTGTTSFQEALRAWPNVAGKPFDRAGGLEARAVQDALRAGTLTGEAFDAHLAAARTDPDRTVVFSAEALAGTPREWFRPLASPAEMARQLAATSWAAGVLVTLRPPRSWIRSTYLQLVGSGYGETYDRYLARTLEDLDAGRGVASWAVTVDAHDAAFGPDAVAVTWFADLLDDPAAHWAAVADRLGRPDLRLLADQPLPHLNENPLGPPALELTLNRLVLSSDLHPARGPRLLARHKYRRRIAPRVTRRQSPRWFRGDATRREPEVVDRLADAAEAIARSHGARVPADLRA